METPEQFGICWACQRNITEKTAVWLDENESVPCCKPCWRKISVGKRVEIALKLRLTSDRGLGIEETLTAIRDLIHSSFGNYIERRLNDDEGRLN